MKRLSDYVGEDAIDLWADLMSPIARILTNPSVQRVMRAGGAPVTIARDILKNCKKEAYEVLTRIDDEPLTGANVIVRAVALIAELRDNEDLAGFFGRSKPTSGKSSFGSATENTEDGAK